MGVVKKFSGEVVVYGVGNALKKFIGFFLLPFYTRALSPSEWGVIDTLSSAVIILSVLLGFKAVDAGSRYYYEAKDEKEKGTVLFTVLVLSLFSFLPSLLLAFFSKFFSEVLFKSGLYTQAVCISCLTLPFVLLNDEQGWIYRYRSAPWRFNAFVLLKSLLNVGLGILLVLQLKKGIVGAQLATLLSSAMVIVYSYLSFSRKFYHYHFSWYWAKKMFRFGFPLMLSGMLVWVYSFADRFFILSYKTSAEVGYYSIGSTFAQPLSLLNMAIGMSFYPFFMSLYEADRDEKKSHARKTSDVLWQYYLVVGFSLVVFLSLFAKEIVQVVATRKFVNGIVVIPFLLFSGIFRQSADMTSLGIFIKEKTKYYFYIVLGISCLSLLLNFLLVKKYGYVGAALVNMISNFMYFLIAHLISQRLFYVKRNYVVILLYFIPVFVFSVGIPLLEILYGKHIGLMIKIFMAVFLWLLPLLLGLVSVNQIKNVIQQIKK